MDLIPSDRLWQEALQPKVTPCPNRTHSPSTVRA